MVIHNNSQVVDTMGMASHAADGVGARAWLGLGRGLV